MTSQIWFCRIEVDEAVTHDFACEAEAIEKVINSIEGCECQGWHQQFPEDSQ